jgi:transposase
MTKQFEKLTDSQWEAISDIFVKRKRRLCLRNVLNALLFLVRTGTQWRNLPAEHPHWTAVNYYFECWKKEGIFEKINLRLNMLDRAQEERAITPSLLSVDSQSVKLNPMLEKDRGIDGNKKVNGRKRQFLVDTGGRLFGVEVHAANIADGKGGLALLDKMEGYVSRLEKFLGDTSYNGIFAQKVEEKGYVFEKAARLDEGAKKESKATGGKKFVVEAKRWVVERSFAWTNFFRRVTKDYERTVESSASWLLLANSTIMLQRIIV